jgi:peptidoglycan/LPS O-acetylase OafA/YrhL
MRIKWFSLVRVTGLLLVLLYHFFKQIFPGGFIGVDIFFTFSGYLITALLIDEYAKSEKIELLSFLKRRFYRIVPPLVMMILLIIPFTFLVRNDFRAGIGPQIAAALGFVTNIYEVMTGGNYESQFIPHLFVHTWSLAIEVHFYLVWGILLWLISKRSMTSNQFRGLVFMISTGFFTFSFLSMFVRSFFTENVSVLYFSTLSHSFPFFLGAMFATMTGVKETTKRFSKNVKLWSQRRVVLSMVGCVALLFLLTFLLDFNHQFTYLFGFVLASLFASLMIYAARVLHEQTPKLQEPAIITFFSDISYGIYLFHWPFYIIFSQVFGNAIAVLMTLLFSIILASLSYYVIEPFIIGKIPILLGLKIDIKPYKKWVFGIVGLLSLLTVITASTAPKVGRFETELLVDSLHQAQNNMNRTHTLAAGDANALSSISIIGDSVALRSSSAFSQLMPEAQLDAAVSRNFDDAYSIFENHIASQTLSRTIVLAVGVNSLENYQESLQQFIDGLPDGYRMVFVSPYNAANAAKVAEVREYELSLAKTYSFVTIADWYKVSVENPAIWSGTDGVHYSDSDTTGATLYVETIQKAIQKAAKKAAKGE